MAGLRALLLINDSKSLRSLLKGFSVDAEEIQEEIVGRTASKQEASATAPTREAESIITLFSDQRRNGHLVGCSKS